MANRTIGGDRRPLPEVKRAVEDHLRYGMNVGEALQMEGRSRSWWEENRRKDRTWAERCDAIRKTRHDPDSRQTAVPDFPEFCERYLGMRLWPHQLNWFDVLEGRQPRWLDPMFTFEPGSAGHRRILFNVPPGHSKTITVSVAYTLWRILKDPSMTVLIISKTKDFASKILWAIKQRLTHPRYADLQLAFGPVDGFKASSDQWSASKVYLWGDERDSQEKDPTLEAVGMGGQIYGNRARLVLVDDAIVLSNAGAWQAQQDWLRQEVASRIGPDDQLVVVGTRVASVDLYRELLNPEHYNDHQVPWTYLAMPAVLEYAEDPADWRTLWPTSELPFSESEPALPGQVYARWTGERLARVRNEVGARKWSLVYQQQDVEDESTFNPVCVRGSISGMRKAGPLAPGNPGHPEDVGSPYIICGMDPAVKGNTAVAVYQVDRRSGRRWLLDMRVITGATPRQMKDCLIDVTETYLPHEWIIEANAFQLSLVQDEEITSYLASRGVPLKPHYTYSNKKDPDYGVASMSGLFGTVIQKGNLPVHAGDNLLELPAIGNPGVKKLVDELVSWSADVPTKRRQQDTIMAMWFCELRAREVISTSKRKTHHAKPSGFLSQRDLDRRFTVNLDEMLEFQAAGSPTFL